MKCNSCQTEIDPRWTHALNSNVCPNCGDSIMPDRLKELLASLKETMQALQEYPQELNDWMLSNHSYIKTDSPNLINYIPEEHLKKTQQEKPSQVKKKEIIEVKNNKGEVIDRVEVEQLQSEERTNEFFKRADIIKSDSKPNRSSQSSNSNSTNFGSVAEKTAHLKKMAEQIRKAGSEGIIAEDGNITLSSDMLENADPKAAAEYQSLVDSISAGGGGMPIETHSPAFDDDTRDDIKVPAHVLRINQAIGGSRDAGANKNARDIEYLEKLKARVNDPEGNSNLGAGSFYRS